MLFEDKGKESAKKRWPPVRVPGVTALDIMEHRFWLYKCGVPIDTLDECAKRFIREFGG